MKFLFPFVDNRRAGSVASRFRRKRFVIIRSIIDMLDRPAKILDVGGTLGFWEAMGYLPPAGITIVVLNLSAPAPVYPNIITVAGDARDLSRYKDNEFDLVVSNSVIEHVGGYSDQKRMAKEMMRVGKRFIVQTPNRSFPLEPHFLVPFFPRLPRTFQIFLLTHFSLGWYKRFPDSVSAGAKIDSIRLLTKKELKNLFDGAKLYHERLFAFTKSFVVFDSRSGSDLIHRRVLSHRTYTDGHAHGRGSSRNLHSGH